MDEIDLEALCLSHSDLERVAEFFDCDVAAAFAFMRTIWLPDAWATAERLLHAITTGDWSAAVYLCDKLREGARCVGATRIMQYANGIERAVHRQQSHRLHRTVSELRAVLGTLMEHLGCNAYTRPFAH